MLFDFGIREKIYLSIVSKKKIKLVKKKNIEKIKNFELNLLSLLDNLTENSVIEINEFGNIIIIDPGLLKCGYYSHICNEEKSINYYLEFICYILPLFDSYLELNFIGSLNSSTDLSLEIMRYMIMPLIRKFFSDEIRLKLINNKDKISRLLLLFKNKNKKSFSFHDTSQIESIRMILSYSSFSSQNFCKDLYKSRVKFFGKNYNFKIFENYFSKSQCFFYSLTIIGLRKNGDVACESQVTNKKLNFKNLEKFIILLSNKFKKQYLLENNIDDNNQILFLIFLLNSKDNLIKKILINNFTIRSVRFIRIANQILNIKFSIKVISKKNKIIINYN